MSLTHTFLNIALPLVTLIVFSIITVPFLFFKLILSVKKWVCIENLTRKVVLITGSASGIGEQLAYEYAKRGAVLSLVDIKEDNLKPVADKARSLGSPDVITILADVSKVEDCKRFVDETVNYFGHLDHLVNNAGKGMAEQLEDCVDISAPRSVMLEKIIGKLKTEKYGDRILAQIELYSDFKPPDERNEQDSEVRAAKRSKTKKPIVLLESSEEDEA